MISIIGKGEYMDMRNTLNADVSKELIRNLALRANDIRQISLKMIAAAGSGHPGGSLSAADILSALFFEVMDFSKEIFERKDRDHFILSKGHGAPALYSVLHLHGFIAEENLKKLRKLGGRLEGHPDMLLTPGVEMSTGSLGQGLSASVGLALSMRLDEIPKHVFTLLGDGESQEGMVWEAAMAAAHYKLDNLVAVLDHNGLQIDGKVADVMDVSPLVDKFLSFGWHVQHIDGHDLSQILQALDTAKKVEGQPAMIVAHTVKGKGVSFMEDNYKWHGVAPNEEELEKALTELTDYRKNL